MSLRRALRRSGNAMLALVRRSPTSGRILLYHEISDRPDPVAAVPPWLFRAHRQWLSASGLRPCRVDTLLRPGPPAGLVALSFDDGHPSAVAACQEVVADGGSATVFVVPGWIEAGRSMVCDWSDLRRLSADGVEVASHDLAHERPCGVPVAMLTERYRAAKGLIEDRIGAAVRGIAYPYGLAPAHAREAAALAGYDYAVSSEPGANDGRTDPYLLRRNEVHGTDRSAGMLIGKLAGSDDWFRPIRALENRLACR